MAVLCAVPVASAARAPTLAEREALTRAMPKWFRDAPAECMWFYIRVSRNNPSYALVNPYPLNAMTPGSRCARWGHDGYDIFRKRAGRWRIVFSGSDPPPCWKRIPRDLVPCLPYPRQ